LPLKSVIQEDVKEPLLAVYMTASQKHYDVHLAPVYSWSTGGIDAALERGRDELAALGAVPASTRIAVDLGAGFGMHAIPLAQNGYEVLAIDSCARLLDELRRDAGALPIQCVKDDLRNFTQYLKGAPELILCMGDTLTHLDSEASVEALIGQIAETLCAGGRFVTSFRDYSVPVQGEARFIPVRADEDRILTCFLEYSDAMVTVNDLLYERRNGIWDFRNSAYRKQRLSPRWVMEVMAAQGFLVQGDSGLSGMVRLEGHRR
jgi:SAM-dependent methyltransferase